MNFMFKFYKGYIEKKMKECGGLMGIQFSMIILMQWYVYDNKKHHAKMYTTNKGTMHDPFAETDYEDYDHSTSTIIAHIMRMMFALVCIHSSLHYVVTTSTITAVFSVYIKTLQYMDYRYYIKEMFKNLKNIQFKINCRRKKKIQFKKIFSVRLMMMIMIFRCGNGSEQKSEIERRFNHQYIGEEMEKFTKAIIDGKSRWENFISCISCACCKSSSKIEYREYTNSIEEATKEYQTSINTNFGELQMQVSDEIKAFCSKDQNFTGDIAILGTKIVKRVLLDIEGESNVAKETIVAIHLNSLDPDRYAYTYGYFIVNKDYYAYIIIETPENISEHVLESIHMLQGFDRNDTKNAYNFKYHNLDALQKYELYIKKIQDEYKKLIADEFDKEGKHFENIDKKFWQDSDESIEDSENKVKNFFNQALPIIPSNEIQEFCVDARNFTSGGSFGSIGIYKNKIAIKKIQIKDKSGQTEFDIKREFLLALISCLEYPNQFARLYGYFIEGKYAYIIMKNHGKDVLKMGAREKISFEDIIKFTGALEKLKITHGDIKEKNVVCSNGLKYLVDFGFASVKGFSHDGKYYHAEEVAGGELYNPFSHELYVRRKSGVDDPASAFLSLVVKYDVKQDTYSGGLLFLKYDRNTKDFYEKMHRRVFYSMFDVDLKEIKDKDRIKKLLRTYKTMIKDNYKLLDTKLKTMELSNAEKDFINKNVLDVWKEYLTYHKLL